MQPWLTPFNPALCNAVLQAIAQGESAVSLLNAAIAGHTNAHSQPLRCVPHSELPVGMAYERFIFDTGRIPTRTRPHSPGALHDACNALMWLHFPRTKARLNALQAAAIAADGITGTRGRLRDALTLFDESALVLCCPEGDAAPNQLAQRDWLALLHTRRSDWHRVLKPLLFGHAVLQKLQTPYPAITAQVWVLHGEFNDLAHVDAALAASLTAQLAPAQLLPLPVLGIPQWWPANSDAAFYDNAAIFRPLSP